MLPGKLKDPLIIVVKKNVLQSRRQFTASLHRQQEARAAKAANALAMKLQSTETEKDLINIHTCIRNTSRRTVGRVFIRH